MKVGLVSSAVPLVNGGGRFIVDWLREKLEERGHRVEAVFVPSTENAATVLQQMAAFRLMRLEDHFERVVTFRPPSHVVRHPRKVVWFIHHMRVFYDLWDSDYRPVPDLAPHRALRAAIVRADTAALREARRLFTLSPTGADRLRRYNGFAAEILPQPLNDPELFPGGEAEGYVLAGGRVGQGKRQHLLVRAMRHAPGLRLVIAGPPDRPEDAEHLRRLAAEEGVGDRLTLDLRFLPRAELARLVNGATAVAYLPFDEDSVGYVTMEAFHAGKPVLTTGDAGGVLEIVRDGETGAVCDPTPEALGAALSALAAEPARAARLGRAARALLDARGITWPATIEKLLA